MPYTPIITPADLSTHLYEEIVNEISRNTPETVTAAINTGIAEVKGYLSRYDRVALFGSVDDDTAATFSDPYLTSIVKDVVVWHLINLANPNVNYEHARKRYEDAIAVLKSIQKGTANYEWPYFDASAVTTPTGISVSAYSNNKRNNSY